ncbi:MAG: cystathionine gamma-lyase [Thermoleophilaceae bacterium]|nr:cystathionine gamma-lyase [Thermoleophilaceae bacterium]
MASKGDSTRSVHAGLPPAKQGEPILPGPAMAAPFHLQGDPADSPYGYTREDNPTFANYEAAVGELEGGRALAFGSGMAALTAVALVNLRPGDTLVAPADGYPVLRATAESYLRPRGIEVRLVPTDDDALLGAVEGARLVMLETPSNPRLDVCDIERIAAAAHEHGAIVAVDNTLATPLGQPVLDLGADLSVVAGTKALTGHGDLLIGHVATRDDALLAPLRAWRASTGAVPGPFETWLAHRSLATLALRLERQCANALAIAEALDADARTGVVRYPGLPGDPAHATAKRQMRAYGPLVSFALSNRATAEAFLAGCELVADATSFGGVHTTAERRARWGHGDDVPEGFIRLSAGIEDSADLLSDIERGMAAAADRA